MTNGHAARSAAALRLRAVAADVGRQDLEALGGVHLTRYVLAILRELSIAAADLADTLPAEPETAAVGASSGMWLLLHEPEAPVRATVGSQADLKAIRTFARADLRRAEAAGEEEMVAQLEQVIARLDSTIALETTARRRRHEASSKPSEKKSARRSASRLAGGSKE